MSSSGKALKLPVFLGGSEFLLRIPFRKPQVFRTFPLNY